MSFHKADIQYDSTYRLEDHKLYVTRTLIDEYNGEVIQPNEKTSFGEFIPFLQRDIRSQVFYQEQEKRLYE